jgi:hypothetical protein
MKRLTSLVAGLAAAALLCVASVLPSHAATTAFVAGSGSDTNPCTPAQPCRSIGYALTVVAGNGGTVSCLDAGPYTESFFSSGAFSVDCRGVVYVNPAFVAFTIQTSAAVTFRNVIFDGSAGGNGAVQISGGNVVFEHCTFRNFTTSPGEAIQFAPTAAGAHLTITDSVFANNGTSSGGGGIVVQPSAGITAGAVIERTQITGNTYGIVAIGGGGTALVEVRSSSVAGNKYDGIWAYAGGSVASIVVEHSASVQNGGAGINAQGANAYVSLNDSTVAWNASAVSTVGGGIVLSYRNNVIAGNLSPGATPTGVNQQ